jgi:hypothetical protein
MLTNNGRCTCEIKSRIAMAKAAFNKKRALFTSKMDGLGTEEETCKMLSLEYSSKWCCKLDASDSRSETPGKF